MTLFFLMVDPAADALHWVRAGHDPAIPYDPEQDAFEKLGGPGIALGVDPNYAFAENRKAGLHDGQVVAVGTDGIWELYTKDGQMYGKRRFRELLRRHAGAPANDILDAVYNDLAWLSETAGTS